MARTKPAPLHRRPAPLGFVALGGALGALARYELGDVWKHHGTYAWPVLVINCIGAFVLGCLLESLSRLGSDEGPRRSVRLLVGTGFCGAFTTYSTFAHDVVTLGREHLGTATMWGVGEVVLGFLCAASGAWLGARFTTSRAGAPA